jgi:Flp pilus assembly pilin Flp
MAQITLFIRNDSGASAVDYGLIALAAGLAISAVLPILMNA